MGDSENFARAADQLSEVLLALEDVDLNPLLADDVRTLLDARDELSDVCLRLRRNQHALAESDEPAQGLGDAASSEVEP